MDRALAGAKCRSLLAVTFQALLASAIARAQVPHVVEDDDGAVISTSQSTIKEQGIGPLNIDARNRLQDQIEAAKGRQEYETFGCNYTHRFTSAPRIWKTPTERVQSSLAIYVGTFVDQKDGIGNQGLPIRLLAFNVTATWKRDGGSLRRIGSGNPEQLFITLPRARVVVDGVSFCNSSADEPPARLQDGVLFHQ